MDYVFKFFEKVKKVSQKSSHPSFKVGAILFSKNKMINYGTNKRKTHPYLKNNGPCYHASIHAELDLIFKVQKTNPDLLKGSSIFVYREDSHGKMKSSRPCPMCLEKIKKVGIKTVIFSTESGIVSVLTSDFSNEFPENYQASFPQCRKK